MIRRNETTTTTTTNVVQQLKFVSEAVSKDDKGGLILRQNEQDGGILLQSIAGKASFFKRTNLQVGMQVLKINGISTKGITNDYAMKLLREETEHDVVIVAQEYNPLAEVEAEAETNTTMSHHDDDDDENDDDDVVVSQPTRDDTMVIPHAREIPSAETYVPTVPRRCPQNPLLRSTTNQQQQQQHDQTSSHPIIANNNDQPNDELDLLEEAVTALIIVPNDKVTASPKPDPEGMVMRYASSRAISPTCYRDSPAAVTVVTPIQEDEDNEGKEEEEEKDGGALCGGNADENDVVSNPKNSKHGGRSHNLPLRDLIQGDAAQSYHTIVGTNSVGSLLPLPSSTTTIITATGRKPIPDAPVGLTLGPLDDDDNPEGGEEGVVVEKIKEHSIFLGSELRPGMILLSINGREVTSVDQAVEVLSKSPAQVTIVAVNHDDDDDNDNAHDQMTKTDHESDALDVPKTVEEEEKPKSKGFWPMPAPSLIATSRTGEHLINTIITKPTIDSPVGLTIADFETQDGRIVPVIIQKNETGLCSNNSLLQPGMRILCIDGVATEYQQTVKALLQTGRGSISIVAGPVTKTTSVTVTKPSKESKIGIGVKRKHGYGLMVTSISPTGLFATTEIQVGMRILMINGVSADDLLSNKEVSLLCSGAEENLTFVAEYLENSSPTTAAAAATATTDSCSSSTATTAVASCCSSSELTPAGDSCSSSATTEITTNNTRSGGCNNTIITFAPPPGVKPGGQWGNGSSCGGSGNNKNGAGGGRCIRCSLFGRFGGLCKYHHHKQRQALYQSPSGRVYNTRGRHVGSTATTKFRGHKSSCAE